MNATKKTLNRKGLRFAVLCLAMAMMLPLSNCQKEEILDEGAGAPEIQATSPLPDVICNPPVTYHIVDGDGNRNVNKCFGGAFAGYPLIPCPSNTTPWGQVEVFKGNNLSYTDPKIYFSIQLAPGWYVDMVESDVVSLGAMPENNGVPVINNDWCSTDINPVKNQAVVECHIDQVLAYVDCYDIGFRLTAVKVNLFSQIIPPSQTYLYASSDVNGGIKYIQDCYGNCPPPTTTLTQGSCTQCNAEVTVTFNYCESVDVSSCKPISKVSIVYADCSTEDFFNPSGTLPAIGGNGKVISDVYVFSGCPGGGPGNGQGGGQGNGSWNGQGNNPGAPTGIHFSAPCPAGACN